MRLDPDWLAGRFDLFEKYCLPSVAAQTAGRLHLDHLFRRRHAAAAARPDRGLPGNLAFVPYFAGTISAAFWPRSLAETLPARTPWLLTTRFDNDDALATDHVARLQAAVSRQEIPGARVAELSRAFECLC